MRRASPRPWRCSRPGARTPLCSTSTSAASRSRSDSRGSPCRSSSRPATGARASRRNGPAARYCRNRSRSTPSARRWGRCWGGSLRGSPVALRVHRIEELAVRFRLAQLVEQELDAVNGALVRTSLSERPGIDSEGPGSSEQAGVVTGELYVATLASKEIHCGEVQPVECSDGYRKGF